MPWNICMQIMMCIKKGCVSFCLRSQFVTYSMVIKCCRHVADNIILSPSAKNLKQQRLLFLPRTVASPYASLYSQ